MFWKKSKPNKTKGINIKSGNNVTLKDVTVEGFETGIESSKSNLQMDGVNVIGQVKRRWKIMSLMQKIVVGVLITIISALVIKYLNLASL